MSTCSRAPVERITSPARDRQTPFVTRPACGCDMATGGAGSSATVHDTQSRQAAAASPSPSRTFPLRPPPLSLHRRLSRRRLPGADRVGASAGVPSRPEPGALADARREVREPGSATGVPEAATDPAPSPGPGVLSLEVVASAGALDASPTVTGWTGPLAAAAVAGTGIGTSGAEVEGRASVSASPAAPGVPAGVAGRNRRSRNGITSLHSRGRAAAGRHSPEAAATSIRPSNSSSNVSPSTRSSSTRNAAIRRSVSRCSASVSHAST
jgi:hypothetical protein